MANTIVSMVDGNAVLIQIGDSQTTRGFGNDLVQTTAKVTDALDSAQATVMSIAKKMVSAIHSAEADVVPDEFEISFSLTFNAEGQAVIAKVSGEASLEIKMTYKRTAKS